MFSEDDLTSQLQLAQNLAEIWQSKDFYKTASYEAKWDSNKFESKQDTVYQSSTAASIISTTSLQSQSKPASNNKDSVNNDTDEIDQDENAGVSIGLEAKTEIVENTNDTTNNKIQTNFVDFLHKKVNVNSTGNIDINVDINNSNNTSESINDINNRSNGLEYKSDTKASDMLYDQRQKGSVLNKDVNIYPDNVEFHGDYLNYGNYGISGGKSELLNQNSNISHSYLSRNAQYTKEWEKLYKDVSFGVNIENRFHIDRLLLLRHTRHLLKNCDTESDKEDIRSIYITKRQGI
jgi:hypothetical protein